jgi:hypothetical protein
VSERARDLADRFLEASASFAAEVERLSAEQWCSFCPEERRTVAAEVHHVAWGYEVEIDAFLAMAEGRPVLAWKEGALDRVNAEAGQAYAECDQAETVALLRRNAAAAATIVGSLTDEQLARSGVYIDGFPAESVDVWIEEVLIGHPGMHRPAIQRAGASAARERESGRGPPGCR